LADMNEACQAPVVIFGGGLSESLVYVDGWQSDIRGLVTATNTTVWSCLILTTHVALFKRCAEPIRGFSLPAT
jgi:hypothetical protein